MPAGHNELYSHLGASFSLQCTRITEAHIADTSNAIDHEFEIQIGQAAKLNRLYPSTLRDFQIFSRIFQ